MTEKAAIHGELIDALFRTALPNAVMMLTFLTIGWLISQVLHQPLAWAALVSGVTATFAKLLLMLVYRRTAAARSRLPATIERWGWGFAALSCAFAMSLGVLGALALASRNSGAQILGIGLMFGYGSGIVAHTSVRPRLAIACLSLSAVPISMAAILFGNLEHHALGASFLLFLGASFQSVRHMHAETSQHIRTRRAMAALAQIDPLTGLPNRLGLENAYRAYARDKCVLAVHCFDLDGFKAVNDRYGHPAGDALLKELGGRIRGVLRADDTAARVGGDEFVVLQVKIGHDSEAELFARRLTRAVTAPYDLRGHAIEVGVSLGFVTAPPADRSLDELVAAADAALYRVKQTGGGVETGLLVLA